MCGDLVSNHGTTGRASIERAEARPSYPILSFAWSHVGAGGAGANQPNPTQPNGGLSLLRLHLRVSTNRPPPPSPPPPPPPSPLPPLPTSHPPPLSFTTLGLPPTATYRRTLPPTPPSPPPPPHPPTTASRPPASVLRLSNQPRYNLLNQCRHTYTHSQLSSSVLVLSRDHPPNGLLGIRIFSRSGPFRNLGQFRRGEKKRRKKKILTFLAARYDPNDLSESASRCCSRE